MLRHTWDYVRDNTISVTGAVLHCTNWFTAGSTIQNPKYDPDTEEPVSIYCVHGTADSAGAFTKVANRLLGDLPANVKCIHLLDFDNRFHNNSNEAYANQLKEKIMTNGDKKVILMGHSRGAVIATLFSVRLAEKHQIEVVAPVICIAGPFKGSYAAVWPLTWLSTSVEQMKRDCEFLQELSKDMQASSVRFHFFGATQDRIVLSGTWFPYYVEANDPVCTLFDRHGHLGVLSSHRMVAKIKTLLFPAPQLMLEENLANDNNAVRSGLK